MSGLGRAAGIPPQFLRRGCFRRRLSCVCTDSPAIGTELATTWWCNVRPERSDGRCPGGRNPPRSGQETSMLNIVIPQTAARVPRPASPRISSFTCRFVLQSCSAIALGRLKPLGERRYGWAVRAHTAPLTDGSADWAPPSYRNRQLAPLRIARAPFTSRSPGTAGQDNRAMTPSHQSQPLLPRRSLLIGA